jgi:superfamily II DNA/RNA helicase
VQEIELRKKPDVVVATPGRMLDHLRNAHGKVWSEMSSMCVYTCVYM